MFDIQIILKIELKRTIQGRAQNLQEAKFGNWHILENIIQKLKL